MSFSIAKTLAVLDLTCARGIKLNWVLLSEEEKRACRS
jgi:hypothetical protein